MTSKRIIASVALAFCFAQWSSAEDVKITEVWIRKQVFQKALQYAESISCDVGADRENVVALVPWKNFEDFFERENARYAVIWYGDIGCSGGTGSVNPCITVVRISIGNSFIVDLDRSSPKIEFEAYIRDIKVIRATASELTLSGLAWGPEDPHCCPSIPLQVHLREDGQGNWRLIEKTRAAQ
jgi:hypothetical protein